MKIRKADRQQSPTNNEFKSLNENLSEYLDLLGHTFDVVIDVGCSDMRFLISTSQLFSKNTIFYGFDALDYGYSGKDFIKINSLVGNVCSKVQFNRSVDSFTSSKLYKGIEELMVPQVRLDCFLESEGVPITSNILLKTDTQGMDIECIQSLGKYLGSAKLVICEVQMRPFAEGMKFFNDSVFELSSMGFHVADFINPLPRSLDQTTGQIDLLLLRKEDPIYLENKW
jgi:hypothetical protein